MKKNILIIIVVVIFTLPAYGQKSIANIDSTTTVLKAYLLKNIRYPAVERENGMQGRYNSINSFKQKKND